MPLITYAKQPATSIYHKAPLELFKSLSQILVLIPGNPGLVDFYETYLTLLQTKLPRLEVLAISHEGFQSTGDYRDEKEHIETYGLKLEAQHKISIIQDFVQEKECPVELFFLSHSMGCFVTQRVVKLIMEDPELSKKVTVKFVGFICPTIIDICKSASGKLFTNLSHYLPLIRIATLFSLLTSSLLSEHAIRRVIQRFFLSGPPSDDEYRQQEYENATNGMLKIFLSRPLITRALSLANEEMHQIATNRDMTDYSFITLPSTYNVKVWSFFADTDKWVSESTRAAILSRYNQEGNENLSFEIGSLKDSVAIKHGFCVDQSVEFSEITLHALSAAL